jgi:Tfp pilus assembly protein PilF
VESILKNAETLEQESKFEAASLEYAKAIQKLPQNGDVHYLFAQFQLRRQDGTGAFRPASICTTARCICFSLN